MVLSTEVFFVTTPKSKEKDGDRVSVLVGFRVPEPVIVITATGLALSELLAILKVAILAPSVIGVNRTITSCVPLI